MIRSTILLACAALWLMGLRVFLGSGLSRARKVSWAFFLMLVGSGVGAVLPPEEIWSRFVLLMSCVPILAAVDVWLFRSHHGLSFWMRACGFEVCSVFAVAGAARWLLDMMGIAAFAQRGR